MPTLTKLSCVPKEAQKLYRTTKTEKIMATEERQVSALWTDKQWQPRGEGQDNAWCKTGTHGKNLGRDTKNAQDQFTYHYCNIEVQNEVV